MKLIATKVIISHHAIRDRKWLSEGYGSVAVRPDRRDEAALPLHTLHQAVVASGAAGLQAGREATLEGEEGQTTGSEVTVGSEGGTRGRAGPHLEVLGASANLIDVGK